VKKGAFFAKFSGNYFLKKIQCLPPPKVIKVVANFT